MKKLCSLCLISFKRIGKENCDFWRKKSPFLLSFDSKTNHFAYSVPTPHSSAKRFSSLQSCDYFPLLREAYTKQFFNAKTTFVSTATCLCVRIILWPEMNKLWQVMWTQDGPVPIQNITCKLWFSCLYEQIFCFPAWNRDIYNKTANFKTEYSKKQ